LRHERVGLCYDASPGQKHNQAASLLGRLWESGTGVVSIQVLQELFVSLTRRVVQPLAVGEAID
jgi:predicted nucleic acid-binding protein